MGWTCGHIRILVGKTQRKRPFGRFGVRWEGDIKLNRKETGWESVDWIYLAQDRDLWVW
jgi:hypothetical protein